MSTYSKQFDEFIINNKLNLSTIDEQIQTFGIVNFFNTITISCLGQPPIKYHNNTHSSGSLIYLPNATQDRIIQNLDIIYVSNLYAGILSNSHMQYNYSGYEKFIQDLINLRKETKHLERSDLYDMRIYIIKYYLNLIYGMLNKDTSVISSSLDSPREHVSQTAKEVIIHMAGYFLNKSKPVYYIDGDSIYVPHIIDIIDLKLHFSLIADKINTQVSTITIDDNETGLTGFITDKKKCMLAQGKVICKGMPIISDIEVLKQNKKFIGQNYGNLFPEYRIW